MSCIAIASHGIVVCMRYAQPYDRSHGPLYRQPRHRTKRLVSIPPNAPAVVRLFFAEMRRQGRIYDEIEVASGIRRATQKSWRHKTNYPSLESLTATFNSLGWDFHATPALELLPPDIAGQLAALSAKMNADIPDVWAALIEIGIPQRDQRERAAERLAEIDAARAEIEADRAKRLRAVVATVPQGLPN